VKAIIIKENIFNDLFENTLSKLEIIDLKNKPDNFSFETKEDMNEWAGGLLRKFYFEVLSLKEKIKESE